MNHLLKISFLFFIGSANAESLTIFDTNGQLEKQTHIIKFTDEDPLIKSSSNNTYSDDFTSKYIPMSSDMPPTTIQMDQVALEKEINQFNDSSTSHTQFTKTTITRSILKFEKNKYEQ